MEASVSGLATPIVQPESSQDPAAATTSEEEYIGGMRLFAVIASVTLVGFLMLLDMSIISTAIPEITTDFHSLKDIGWYGAAYNLVGAAFQPLTGKIYTNFKAKWTFISFLFFFALGSLVCGVASSSAILIGGRAVAGFGISGLQNGAMTIITNSVPSHKRPALLGVLLGCSQLGIIVGPIMGGAITEYSTWRWCFYLNLPAAAVVACVLIIVPIPERSGRAGRPVAQILVSELDLFGFALFAPSAVMFLLGLEFGGRQYPWQSATVVGLLVGSVGMFAVFIAWEHRQGDRAMIPLSMVRKREVWTSMLAGTFLMGGTVLIFSFYLPVYFQAVRGVSPLTSGLYVLPNIITSIILAVISGVLVTRLRYYVPWVVFGGACASIASGLFTTLSPSTTTGEWVGYQILLGARGAALQMSFVAVQTVLPEDMISIATALLVFSQTFGGAIFLTISQTVFNHSLGVELASRLPGQVADAVMMAGARGVRDVVSGDDLAVAIQAYSVAVGHVFYVTLAAGLGIFLSAWGMGWHDISKKTPAGTETEKGEA
ncbi:major facilitator superfamily domain-containing protein [Cercophora newfieldiana]|uniref:Major facilitator superfamily domain-containing protein n=1 Tax=Cercophora newfieldiana TaxID=92897 RepID=A0AA40CSN2_9PEZI|nr:major facilitator superfamily domain-containing protein [Cercophora newfieldiana]